MALRLTIAATALAGIPMAAALPASSDANAVEAPKKRVIGGELAEKGDFPFIANLLFRYKREDGSFSEFSHLCGGSLLNANTVLTAAHCWEESDSGPENVMVRMNSLNGTEGGVTSMVKEIVWWPGWIDHDYRYGNDMALWHLETPIEEGDGIEFVKLPEPDSWPEHGAEGNAAGWGYLDDHDDDYPEMLHKVKAPIVGDEECKAIYKEGNPWGTILEDMVCYGEPGKGSCGGDSGGPVLVDGVQVGVVSWGVNYCGGPVYPSVGSRVSFYLDWIKENSW